MGLLLLVFYEDMKHRSIKIITMIQFGVLSMVYAFILETEWIEIGLNALFISILLISIVFYIRIRFGSVKGLNKSYLGLGDILLWILFIPLLETIFFVQFFVVSLVVSLVVHYTIRRYKFYGPTNRIPLAGIQSIVLVVYLVLIP